MPGITRDQLAKVFGCTERTINNYVKSGMPYIKRGEYDLVACVQWRIKTLEEEIQKARSGGETVTQVELRLKRANAEIRELELAELRGELIALADVRRHLSDVLGTARSRMLAMPKRAAAQVVGLTDIITVEQSIERIVHEVLTELSNIDISLASGRSRKLAEVGHPGITRDTQTAPKAKGKRVGRSLPVSQPRVERRARKVANG